MAGINRVWNGKRHIKRKSDSQYKISWHCGNVQSDTRHSIHVAVDIGHSPSGKAREFDSRISLVRIQHALFGVLLGSPTLDLVVPFALIVESC